MLFEKCGHYDGKCPCLHCLKFTLLECNGCLKSRSDGCAVDTDTLCEEAKAYCESGRKDGDG